MNSAIKVSIVIPTKNPGTILRRVIASLLAQETKFCYDILVIDSGSTDGTIDYINSVKSERLRLHTILPAEFGHGRTRNLAISLTTGEYIAMITHDACPVMPDWLDSLVQLADSDQRIAGVFGRHIAYPDASIFTKHELELHFSGFDEFPIVFLSDPKRYEVDVAYRQFLHFFSDNNALIRRQVWECIPYPDVSFAEDQLWAKKIIEAGWFKAYSAHAVVFHSHNYSFVERLQRSFDESYAFFRLFGYRLCPDLVSMIKSWAGMTIRDLRFTKATKLWRQAPFAVVIAAIDNLMRVFGHYLGTRGDKLPPRFHKKLSRDHRVLRGWLKIKK
ncbi:MAG: family 2 glycosyl transferase [Solimicrobium sp.]|jgi:rhamnosyltransferase|nr:family 2 glycosyl transferase [Solimicrobium sp.]